MMLFNSKTPHYEYLRKKWLNKQKTASEKFMEKHGDKVRHLTLGGLSGLLLLNTPGVSAALPGDQQLESQGITKSEDKNKKLAEALKNDVPKEMRPLSEEEEKKIGNILSEQLGVKATAQLQGIKLNRSYGVMGGEQHLYRYPGDNLYKHADNAADWAMYGPAGIAPGLGAWGYFAPSEAALTNQEKMEEKYYLAVQTFLVPGYAENVKKYSGFFKHRKMVVVNPETGQAVVAVIGDAGPAEWTGKHLGGSPEVMHFTGLASGSRKGPVLYFFLDDPDNKVPLGPIEPGGKIY